MSQLYPRPARIHEQAHQAWYIVSSFVAHGCKGQLKRKGVMTYGELAVAMGYPIQTAVTLGRPLAYIARYCRYHDLPLLNAMVVDQNGDPGDEIILAPGKTLKQHQKEVKRFSWFDLRSPSMRALRVEHK